MQKMQTESR